LRPSHRNDGVDAGFQRTTISQRFGGALASGGLKGRATGDDDLPLREPLHERRAKYDAVRAKQTAADDDDGDDVLPGGAVCWATLLTCPRLHSHVVVATHWVINAATVHCQNCLSLVCAWEAIAILCRQYLQSCISAFSLCGCRADAWICSGFDKPTVRLCWGRAQVRSALREREMDDTYTAVAEAAAARKKARKAAPAPAMPPPLPEEEADGARGINQARLPCLSIGGQPACISGLPSLWLATARDGDTINHWACTLM